MEIPVIQKETIETLREQVKSLGIEYTTNMVDILEKENPILNEYIYKTSKDVLVLMISRPYMALSLIQALGMNIYFLIKNQLEIDELEKVKLS